MSNINILYFDRIDVSEETDVKETANHKSVISGTVNKGFKFQPCICKRCHDLSMMSLNLSDIAILNIKRSDYRCIISGISKSEAVNIIQNINSTGKRRTF